MLTPGPTTEIGSTTTAGGCLEPSIAFRKRYCFSPLDFQLIPAAPAKVPPLEAFDECANASVPIYIRKGNTPLRIDHKPVELAAEGEKQMERYYADISCTHTIVVPTRTPPPPPLIAAIYPPDDHAGTLRDRGSPASGMGGRGGDAQAARAGAGRRVGSRFP